MSLVHGRTKGALAAAALLLGLAGCQRADERASAERDLAGSTPPRAAQDVARRQPGATPTTSDRKRDLQQVPPKTTAAATVPSPTGQRAPATANSTDTRTMGAPAASGAQTMGAADRVDDASLTRQVSAAIAADQQLRAVRIDVDTQNGIVTLSGPAPTATAKEHAGEVARTVKGVVSVNNQLTLASG